MADSTPVRLRQKRKARLSGVDLEHEQFKQKTSDMAFPNRVMIKLEDEYFLQHTRHHLGDAMPYRRIPISAEGIVWYFFKEAKHIRVLMDAIASVPEDFKRKPAGSEQTPELAAAEKAYKASLN
jgi:hypothetical protein